MIVINVHGFVLNNKKGERSANDFKDKLLSSLGTSRWFKAIQVNIISSETYFMYSGGKVSGTSDGPFLQVFAHESYSGADILELKNRLPAEKDKIQVIRTS